MAHVGAAPRDRNPRQGPRARLPLRRAAAGAVVFVASVTAFLAQHSGTSTAQTVGDLSIQLAVVVAAVSVAWAAHRASDERPAWTMMAVAATLWLTGNAFYTTYGLTRDHVYPFPSLADAGFIGYSVPLFVALVLFPQPAQTVTSRLRSLLDALVIAISILFISWSTVLGSVYQAGGGDLLTRLTGLAYPVVDVLVASLVLTLGMRRPAGQRVTWLLLGGGLVVLTVTDSLYVYLLYAGETGLTGTVLTAGWMSAWLLVSFAPWWPRASGADEVRGGAALAIELVPYVPVLFAIVASAGVVIGQDRFLLSSGAILLAAVTARQVMIVFENVTLTRDLEAKVTARTAELAELGAIVNSSPDAILSTTRDGIVTSWNPGAERLYGWRSEEIVGQDVGMVVPAWRRDEEEVVLARVRRGEQVRSESERVRKDGSLVPVALTVSPIYGGGAVIGMASIQQDITARRAAQADLEVARKEALESSQLKSEFLATMSHEIRTPMNGVIGLTSLLLETRLDETQRQYAEGVAGAGEALLAVINDILDFSKLEAGKVDLELANFDPRRLVEEVGSLLAPTARKKSLEMVAYCRPEVPAVLVGDAGRIRQVLLNLSSNAVKFTAAGEVAVTVRSVRDGAGRVAVRFEVADTGIGVSMADRERLFEAFSQADASTTRRYGGTGLGLAISRRLTEIMGGEIGVDSVVGAGSTFWFQLPLPVAAESESAEPALSHDLLSDLSVLVVDDNATNRLVLESQLTAWGMRPEVIAHPRSVLALLRDAVAAGQPYAIAVLDMCMPEMDGVELAGLISADRTLSGTRLIMLTSTTQVDEEQMKRAGIREWLTKPVRSSEFYDRLMRVMAHTGTLPEQRHPEHPLIVEAARGRVLVVEDNALNQLVAEGVVSKLGYEVDIVANGVEALDAISTIKYSAVLMDCHMPIMDGFTATEELRRREHDSDRLPIIGMTAGAMAEDREKCLAAGMDDYVSKPVNVAAIKAALASWVGPQPGATADGEDQAIDVARLAALRQLGPDDGQGLLPALVDAFVTDSPRGLLAIRQAAAAGNSHDLEQAAHQLNGSAANIGATRVAELCARLEATARTSASGGTAAILDQLATELDNAARILRDDVTARR